MPDNLPAGRMKRIYRSVVGDPPVGHGFMDGGIYQWATLECGHSVARRKSVMPWRKKVYCQKCSRVAAKKVDNANQ